ncbi:MAG: hypothetical protein Q4C61_16250 [Lachnospiraceae bacterium]|nr:hypothetical protein [Lachnospiraceae bacterium]
MSMQYVKELTADQGEKFHVKSVVKTKCEHYVPFTIKSARYELLDLSGNIEAEGECTITDHELDALVEFRKSGTYCLRFIYKIADETWVDNVKIKVG